MKYAVLLAISDAMLASDDGRYFPYDSLKNETIVLVNYTERLIGTQVLSQRNTTDGYAERLADKLFHIYQNVSDDHLTPDGGRSMMVGDVVRVSDFGGQNPEYLMCDRSGWKRVTVA